MSVSRIVPCPATRMTHTRCRGPVAMDLLSPDADGLRSVLLRSPVSLDILSLLQTSPQQASSMELTNIRIYAYASQSFQKWTGDVLSTTSKQEDAVVNKTIFKMNKYLYNQEYSSGAYSKYKQDWTSTANKEF